MRGAGLAISSSSTPHLRRSVHRALGALAAAVAHRRRAHSHDAGDGAARWRRNASARGRTRSSALQRFAVVSVSVPAVRHLSSRAARRAGAAAAARSADARQPVPQHPGGVPSRAAAERPAAGGRAARWPRRAACSTGRSRTVERRGARRARARHRSRVARRGRGDRARPSRLAAKSLPQDGESWLPGAIRVRASACPATTNRDPRSVADPARVDGRFLTARLDRSRRARTDGRDRCASPITRPGRTAPISPTMVDGGRVLQPVLYGLALESRDRRVRRGGPALVLHVGGQLQRCTGFRSNELTAGARAGSARRSSTARSSRGTSPRGRPRAPAAAATSCASAARERSSAATQRARPGGAEADLERAEDPATRRRDRHRERRPAPDRRRRSTTRSSSRPPQAPARPPSWSRDRPA